MRLVVLSNEELYNELLAQDKEPDLQIVRISEVSELALHSDADMVMDLSFENNPERVQLLKRLNTRVVINCVTDTLAETDPAFIRINGWPGFLRGTLVEGSLYNEAEKQTIEELFLKLGKSICWLPDQAGFITPRVISAIINEGYFALSEGVSTKEEIDTAMKLGTNYPYGPFEWSEKIGLHNILLLLTKLSKEQSRYQPCPLLTAEARH